ncbi:chromosome-partitioning ATPase Soj [Variibacter gotjawalensis]|uniref:Iron-sulfur cluster carrier protein n=1 Tax=Variibacter gotjawalensis TaxID=1333996 RepID=A0A0S3PZ36_9BRAD|nr:iron-sulfur cluster carrier protein ApbC [Variibacter gotjawalensis]NIK47007.1 ATP-binding protein involved in chromosome partitioning [Variibacter gotjawalensis]RZS48911.1 ATP-binding protein involved in chromosome partitioning [Variibacter gotjawalensis]BAT61170.1 chromosome-partitioning ATPase Soj [Variibacter gotjawalensis]
MPVSKDDVTARLGAVMSPENVPLPQTGRLSDVVVTDGKVFFSISIAASAIKQWENVRAQAEAAVKAMPGVVSVMVALTAERAGGASAPAPRPAAGGGGHSHAHGGHSHSHGQPAKQSTGNAVPGIASIIAVASGKGGVGKSTTAVNLALALRDLGLRVGMLDADIYGPSVPKLLAVREKPETLGGNRLKPITAYGMSVMSIGFLIEEETPMIWRGPMVMSALTQMLREVEWGTLDVLVVDMPPGTGDAQLTMAQQVPLRGAVIVSTPQDLALIDARRGIAMFKRVDVPVLGIVENMSTFVCPECGTESHIFGHGGARKEAERLGVPFLGEVPLHMAIRETSDAGKPVVATDPESVHAKAYRAIAMKVRDQIAAGGGGRPAPKIVIEA